MRFQVSRVMDVIEQRLTTDVTWAQAVVDLAEVARLVDLDGGRPVNLIRIGMVVDALSRYLVDGGAMLYGVVDKELLSEAALTSKERMVLGRWGDDGLIEVTPEVADRAAEVADLTGLPLIALDPGEDRRKRFGRLGSGAGRVLRLTAHSGAAALSPWDDTKIDLDTPVVPVAGRARPPKTKESAAGKEPDGEGAADGAGRAAAVEVPLPVEVFLGRGAARITRTRVARHRYRRADPAADGVSLLAREWRCQGLDCPAFGEHRRTGQPVPRLRGGVPVCPRHGEPVTDVGPRPAAQAVAIMVDDLPRRRLVVRAGSPVRIGRATGDPEVISVAPWLHKAAASWIAPVQVRLELAGDALTVVDLSDHGTLIWQRSGPEDPGHTHHLRQASWPLGEWDSVELYTGIEVVRGDRRPGSVLGRDEPPSVLVDAPTAAHRQVSVASR